MTHPAHYESYVPDMFTLTTLRKEMVRFYLKPVSSEILVQVDWPIIELSNIDA